MRQRRIMYLRQEDVANVERDINLSLDDAKRAIQALKNSDIKELRQNFSLLASRANYSFNNYDKLKLTPLTPKEQALLKQFGFEPIESGSDSYLDFKKIIREFDGTIDRHEKVTYSVSFNKWYASSEHIDLEGNEVHTDSVLDHKILKHVLLSLFDNRKKAPSTQVVA